MSRTRVARWTPPLLQALRLAARPAIIYFLFTVTGFIAFFGSVLWYEGDREILQIFVALAAGIFGIVLGMAVAILRMRMFPILVLGGIFIGIAVIMLATLGSFAGLTVALAFFFFCFAFPCGLLALQHRYELLASFWPAVGWIGGVFVIINHEGRLHEWEQDKITAWMPVPLAFLGLFLIQWLFYLAAKQAMRVELWQALSGGVARRIVKKPSVGALPRRNLLSMLVVAALLFGAVAALSPYLWRTGKGDRPSKQQVQQQEEPREPRKGPDIDGEALIQQMKAMAQAAKNTVLHLWPLLFLFLLYRPAKRALLKTHLLTPIVPTPPTERIDNNWEYVRIAAEDAGVVPAPSDSVEQLLVRIHEKRLGGPGLANAAAIYARTRYGFVVGRGDAIAMRQHAIAAAKELHANTSVWQRFRNAFRRLS